MRSPWPIALLLVCACKPEPREASNDQPSTPEVAPQLDPAAATDEDPSKADASKRAPKPKPDEARALRRKLTKLLNEGRELTKAGNYAEGMAKYREALAIDASDVAVLGELGWAAYRSGDLELAHRTTVGALKFVREDRQRGMLLYNLGRVEEDRENVETAIAHYRDSLAARPGNATVQARLDALLAEQASPELDPEGEARDVYSPLAVIARDLPSLEAACERIRDDRCEDYTTDADGLCTCEPKLQATPGADLSWGLLELVADDFTHQRAWLPAVQTDAGWTVFAEVLYEYNPGVFGIYEEVELGTSTVEPLLDKGTQLVLHLVKHRMDRDMGLNEIESEDHAKIVVCARDGRGAYCTRPLRERYAYLREVEFEDLELEDGEPIEHDQSLPIRSGFSADLTFENGVLVVTWTGTEGNFADVGEGWETHDWILPDGKYPLVTLLGLAATPAPSP